MIQTHATFFDGDPEECVKWLGYARGVLRQMVDSNNPAVKSKHLFLNDDTEIWITKNPNSIRIKSGGDKLFCTSFNAGVDNGTQVYKKPYPPITQGDLITLNPQTIPYPDYSARSDFRGDGLQSYWVDSKEENAISWSYETFYVFGANRKGAKLSIQGLEPSPAASSLWYKEPLHCALIPFDKETPDIQRFVMIYRDRVNYSGAGTTRYCAVFDYVLDFDNSALNITLVSTFNLTTAGYDTKTLYGLMSDAKTLIFQSYKDVFMTVEGYTSTAQARTINYSTLSDDYLSFIDTGEIFAETPVFRYQGNDLLNDTEMFFPIIDVRDKVRFCTRYFKNRTRVSETEIIESGLQNLEFTSFSQGSVQILFKKASWSISSGLSLVQFSSGNTLYTTTKRPSDSYNPNDTPFPGYNWDFNFVTTSEIIDNNCYGLAHTKKDLIYSEYSEQYVSSRIEDAWGATIETISSSYSCTGSIKSKKAGYIMDVSTSSHYIEDYAYTDGVFVGSFYDDDVNYNRSWTSAVLGYKAKSKKVLANTDLKTISVTKLP